MNNSISVESVAPPRAGMLLAYGFRPFFLATAGWAVAAIALWVAALTGVLPDSLAVDLAWHQHEMLFGAFAAAVAGFVLTAFPEWTKTGPLTGQPLGWLVGLWVAGRIAMLSGSTRLDVALIAAAFLPVVTAVAAAVVIRVRATRLVLFVALLGLLSVLSMLWQAGRIELLPIEPTSLALPSLLVYAALVTLASGRIVPIVSQLALREDSATRLLRIEPASSEVAAVALLALAGVVAFEVRAEIAGWVAFAAVAAQIHRVCEWWIGRSARHAYIWPFHLSGVMIATAAGAIGLDNFGVPMPASGVAHALGLGGAGLATLAVMTIAGLLHTGHTPLRVPFAGGIALALLACSAVVRVAAAWLPGNFAGSAVDAAALLWVGAFLLYLGVLGPRLLRPRIDGKPG
ncbi:MAG: NnrS family protein [Bradyrhizobiaceae bacterium]|nr:NnrS family protein [Bradyrhizobiaceae bacterium]